MGDRLTYQKVQAAAEFGPALCRPVAYLVSKARRKLPAQDVFIHGMVLPNTTYLDGKSPHLKYHYDSLVKFKRLASKEMGRDFFTRYYDPALQFFKEKMKRRSSVVINCRDELQAAEPASLYPVDGKKIDAVEIEKYLNERFGFEFTQGLEAWFQHQIFFAEIREGKDLVLVIPEHHGDLQGAKDLLRLYDRLRTRKGEIDIRLALEAGPTVSRNALRLAARFESDAEFKRLLAAGYGAEGLLKSVSTPEMIDYNCKKWVEKNPGQSKSSCASSIISAVKNQLMMFLMGPRREEKVWALENDDVSREAGVISQRWEKRKALSSEQRIALAAERHRSTRQRDKIMAETLVARVAKEMAGKKPTIVIVPTGAFHALEIIRALAKKGDVSVVGLMQRHHADTLDDIAGISRSTLTIGP